MIRSMYSAVSALRAHQTYMDVIGNNIANVNTTGYKAGRMTFQDVLSQTVRGSTASTAQRAGMNPAQVGLGSQLGTIDIMQAQGDIMATNKPTDLAIQGDGFFIVNEGLRNLYTRDGSFDVSSDGYLVSPSSGLRVQGWVPDPSKPDINGQPTINTSNPITDIKIPLQGMVPGRASDKSLLSGNLDSRAVAANPAATPPVAATTFQSTVVLYNSLGASHNLPVSFTKDTAAGAWIVSLPVGNPAAVPPTTPVPADPSMASLGFSIGGGAVAQSFTVHFGANGKIDQINGAANTGATVGVAIGYDPAITTATTPQNVVTDFSKITQLAAISEVNMSSQNGYGPGSLLSFEVSQNGEVSGIYSNGVNQSLGQIALARIPNPSGLSRQGSNAYAVSNNSGLPLIGAAATGGRGTVVSGSLEMSNVDLAQEFTNMISAQRGFQANSRIITTSDEMLQELISLKR